MRLKTQLVILPLIVFPFHAAPVVHAQSWTAAATGTDKRFNADDLRRIDTTIEDFRQKYAIPGLSLAIAKDGRLVFTKGYGYADKDRKIAVNRGHLFRIASVSKPITSIAVFTLVDQGKLRLDDKVFGPRGILGDQYGLPQGFPNKGDVTVQQLLEHSGGGWANDHTDPMFKRLGLGQTDLTKWVLANYELPNPPGEKYAYSNFGYLLLGRVIEKKSGQTYEDFVSSAVLKQAGVRDMHIAGDTLAQRRGNEVVYFDDRGDPYGIRASRMDAHGGWIANPTDLLRIVVRLDGPAGKPGILRPATLATMTTASAANKNYAKGWCVNAAHNWWHSGSMPGTQAFLVRAHNGFCWAILMNQRKADAAFAGDVDRLGWTVINGVREWPFHDLF